MYELRGIFGQRMGDSSGPDQLLRAAPSASWHSVCVSAFHSLFHHGSLSGSIVWCVRSVLDHWIFLHTIVISFSYWDPASGLHLTAWSAAPWQIYQVKLAFFLIRFSAGLCHKCKSNRITDHGMFSSCAFALKFDNPYLLQEDLSFDRSYVSKWELKYE